MDHGLHRLRTLTLEGPWNTRDGWDVSRIVEGFDGGGERLPGSQQ